MVAVRPGSVVSAYTARDLLVWRFMLPWRPVCPPGEIVYDPKRVVDWRRQVDQLRLVSASGSFGDSTMSKATMSKATAIFGIVLALGLGVAFVASSMSSTAQAGQQGDKP